MKVNFFIIGQPKTGTTSLYHYLKKHPNIFLPEKRKLHYFAIDHNQYRTGFKELNRIYYRKYYNYSFNDYLKNFKFTENHEIYGDITPDYFYSNEAPKAIFEYNKDAFIIALIREPLDFLKSFHLQLVNSGNEYEKNFWKAFSLQNVRNVEPFMQNPHCPKEYLLYSRLIKYQDYIKKYFSLFPKRFKIIVYEDFKRYNSYYLCELHRFLSLTPIYMQMKIESNVSRVRSCNLNRIKSIYIVRMISLIVPWRIKNYLKRIKRTTNSYKATQTNESVEDKEFRGNVKRSIYDLQDYIVKNDLLLGSKPINLVRIWGYDKRD